MATSAVRQQRACVKQPAFVASLLLLSVALDFCCAEQVTCGSTTTTIGNYTSYTINQCATQTNIVGSNNSYLNTTFTVAGGTALPLISLQAQGELGYVTIDISGITASAFTPVGNAVGPIRISGDYVHHVTVRWTNVHIYNATSRASLVELLYLTAITPGLTGGHDIAVLVDGCVFELRGTWGVLSTVFQINTAFNAKSLSRTIINISSSQMVVSPTALRAGLREYVVRVGVPLNGTAVQQTNVTDLTLLIKDSQILSSFCRPQTTDQPCALVNLDDNLKLVPFSIAFSFFLRVSLRIDNSVVTAIHADSTRYQTTSLVSIFLFTNSRQDSAIPYGAGEQLTVVAQRSNLSISTTSEGQLLNAMYFEQLTSINVIVSNVTWYADAIGMYVLSKSYRNLEMIRILAVGTVTDLTVVVQDVSITHLETCGIYQLNQSMVDSFPNDMQGVASIAVHLGMSALTNALFNLTRIDMYTDCRNGSITGIVSAQLPVSLGFFGQSATVLTIEQSVLATGVTVHATDCHHKAHIGFAPFLFPAFQMALVGSSLCILSLQGFQTNMEVTVTRSSVEMLSMDFRLWPFASGADCRIGPNFPLAGPYRMFGSNVTSIIVAADLNNTQYVCLPALIKSARGMNTLVPAYHRNAHITILSCVVTNPWAFLRSTDATAFYVAPTLVDGVTLVVNSSRTVVSPTNIGSSGVALMLLSSTTVSNSRFDVYNCTNLVTLLYGSASSSTINNLQLTIIDSVFQRFTLAPGNEISSTPSYAIAPQPGSISSSVDVSITTAMVLRSCAFNGYRGYADPAGTMLAEITGQCNTINGSRPKKQFLRTASVTDVTVFSGCGVGSSRTLTFPAPPNASTATQSTVQKAASAATASGVVAAGLVVATLSIPTGFGTVPLLQMSSSALRLRASCASSSLRSSDNGGGGGSDSSGSSSNGNAGIGTEVADNPLQIALGATLSYAGGTIVGNTVLVVGGALVVVVLQVVQRGVASWFGGKASRQQRHQRRQCALRMPTPEQWREEATSAAIPLYGVVIQPTAAAGALLLASTHSAAGTRALGALGVAVALTPLLALAWYVVRMFPLLSVARQRRGGDGALVRFATPGWRWTENPSAVVSQRAAGSTAAVRARVRTLLHVLICAIEPYRGGFHWMFVVELGSAYLQGLVVGVALALGLTAENGCAVADASLYVLLGICGVTLVVIVACRPYAMHFDTAQSTVMNVLASAVIVLSILAEDDAATVITMVQALWSLAMLLLPVTVAVLELFGQLEWRHDKAVAGDEAGVVASGVVVGPAASSGTKLGPPRASPLLEAQLKAALVAERHRAAATLLAKGQDLHALRQWDGEVAYGRTERVDEAEFEAYCADLRSWSEANLPVTESRVRSVSQKLSFVDDVAKLSTTSSAQKSATATPYERLQRVLQKADSSDDDDGNNVEFIAIVGESRFDQRRKPPQSQAEVLSRLNELVVMATRSRNRSRQRLL